MVWFQCESCGENLKKPKLVNHFRGCAARKLSCIDCGVVFDQQSVQVHTSCVSETEKYGPKDGSNGAAQKPKGSQAHKDGDVDLSIGLSTSCPWNCSLCNVNATSYETLEGHSQGKKHRAKARAAHAKLNSVPVVEAASNSHGNGSQPKASAETKGLEPVEDGILLPTFKAGFPWTCSLCEKPIWESIEKHEQGLKHRAKVTALKSIEKHSQGLKQAALAKLNSVTVVEVASNSHDSKEKRKREKGRAACAEVEAPSNSHGNGSQSKASAEIKGLERVEDGKLLPTSKGNEGDLKKRKAGDEREKKSGEKRKKSKKSEKLLDAAAEEGIVSSENGGGDKLEVENSATSLAFGKPAKWRKLTTKVLLNVKAPEKGIKIKELFNEILPLATAGADNFDKKALKKQLTETLNASSKFEVRGDWVALAITS